VQKNLGHFFNSIRVNRGVEGKERKIDAVHLIYHQNVRGKVTDRRGTSTEKELSLLPMKKKEKKKIRLKKTLS